RWGGVHAGSSQASLAAQFGQNAAHIVMVVVPDDHWALLRIAARHDVVGRVDGRAIETGQRVTGGPSNAVAAPGRSGRDRDMPRSKFQHMLGFESAVAVDRYVAHPL